MPHRRVKAYVVRHSLRIAHARFVTYPWQMFMLFLCRTKRIFLRMDPETIRVILGGASAGWATLALPWPWVNPPIFQRMGYGDLHRIAPAEVWAMLMSIHAIGVFWRFYGPTTPAWQLGVNIYGFCIWSFVTAMLNFGVGAVTPGTALEWTCCAAAFWCFVMDRGTVRLPALPTDSRDDG